MKSKIALSLSLLVTQGAVGSYSLCKKQASDLVEKPDVSTIISSLWNNEKLTNEQKVTKLKISFTEYRDAVEKLLFQSLLSRESITLEPEDEESGEASSSSSKSGMPLNQAFEYFEDPSLFKLLLQFHANPELSVGRSTIVEKVGDEPEYNRIVTVNAHRRLIGRDVKRVLCGSEIAEAVTSIRKTQKEKELSNSDILDVLNEVRTEISDEKAALENLIMALGEENSTLGKSADEIAMQNLAFAAAGGLTVGVLGMVALMKLTDFGSSS